MRQWVVPLAASFVLAGGGISRAQGICEAVLKYASYNYSTESQKNTAFKRTYDSYCRGDQAADTSSLNIGIDAIVEGIPVGFDLGTGSASQRLSNFCKIFSQELSSNAEKYLDSALVSVEAVEAWRECVKLYGEGVEFAPTINTTQALIGITKKDANPIRINGVKYKATALQCVTSDSDANGQPMVADMTTKKELLNGDSWTIACDRVETPVSDEIKYLEADLTVLTSKGNFSLKVPPDGEIGTQSSAAINAKIADLETQMAAQAKRQPSVDCRTASQDSGKGRAPSVQALVPVDALDTGYKLLGGGCELAGNPPGPGADRAHNGPITSSRPADNGSGWFCQAMDPPNIPLDYAVRAFAVYCKVSMPE